MNWLTGIVAILFFGLLCAEFHDIGYMQGYEARQKDEKDWWENQEREAEEMQKEIWREEPKKGRWV